MHPVIPTMHHAVIIPTGRICCHHDQALSSRPGGARREPGHRKNNLYKMILGLFGFLQLSIADILDIILLAIIIYFLFRWAKGSSAMSIVVAIVSLYVIRVIVGAFNMRLMTALMEAVLDVGVLALIVIFQPEIRKFLISLGNKYMSSARGRALRKKLFGSEQSGSNAEVVTEVAEAVMAMSRDKTGALIVFMHEHSLDDVIDSGDRIDASVHRRLIMNLFFKNSPLHDGALVIGGGRLVAARCTLPMTDTTDIPASFGMRHKAAIGITEVSDADVVLVSEESGHVAFVKGGKVKIIQNINELKLLLTESSGS